MPFIRGRYHINPIAGQALEAAREAEETLAAAQGHDENGRNTDDYEWESDSPTGEEKGPIHRVEIETASLVPSHSGQATPGFVARIHRAASEPTQAAAYDRHGNVASSRNQTTALLDPETHVFANDGGLIDFLQRELAKDSARRSCPKR